MAAKGVKWGTVESRAYEPGSAALPSDAASDSEGDDARQPPPPRAQRPIEPTPPQPQPQQQQQQQRRLPVTLYPEAPPPQQVFEGSGDVASATAEAQRAARLISANGVDAYEAATEGAKAGALAAGREAKRLAQREFSAERARAVAAKMEAAAQLDPADALPFGFVTKLREGHEAAVTHCTWADDARHIASCDAAGKVCVWDTHTCSVRREYRGHTGAVAQVVFSPVGDNDRLASAGKDMTVRLWSKRSGAQLIALREQRCAIGCLAFCHDGSLLATGGEDGSVYIYNMEKLEREAGHRRVAGSSGGGGGGQGEEADLASDLADAIQGAELVMLSIEGFPSRGEGHTGALRRCAWSPKDDFLASAGEDRVVRVWSVKDRGGLSRALEGHQGPVTDLVFCPHGSSSSGAGAASRGGRALASCSLDGSIRLWDWRSGACSRVLLGSGKGGDGHMGGVTALCWTLEGGSAGGGRLVSGGMDRSLCVWGVRSGACLQVLPGVHKHHVTALSMCSDGLHVAVASADGTVGLFGAQALAGWEWVAHSAGVLARRAAGACRRLGRAVRGALDRGGDGVGEIVGSAAARYGGGEGLRVRAAPPGEASGGGGGGGGGGGEAGGGGGGAVAGGGAGAGASPAPAAPEDEEEALKRGLHRAVNKSSGKWGGVRVTTK